MPTRRPETSDPAERMRFLIDAGKAYAAGGYMLSAEGFFRAAMEQVPGDPAPYTGAGQERLRTRPRYAVGQDRNG